MWGIRVLLLISLAARIIRTEDVSIIYLQENGIMSPESLASFNYTLSSAPDHTLCIRVNFFGLRPFIPIFVACEKGGSRRCIRLELIEGTVLWKQYATLLKARITHLLQSNRWNLICVTKTNINIPKKSKYELYFNGESIATRSIPQEDVFRIDGTPFHVIFGQISPDADSNDGLRSLRGEIGAYILYEHSLTHQEILKIYSCRGNYVKHDLLQRSNLKLQQAEMKTFDNANFCIRGDNLFYVPFLKRRSFAESLTLCRTLGGKISRPITKRENKRLSEISKRYKDSCIDPEDHLKRLIWLGMERTDDSKKWIDPISRGEVQYFNWRKGHYEQNCPYLKFGENDTYDAGFTWETTYCSNSLPLQLCTICEFSRGQSSSLKIRLGGMCAPSQFDTEYYLMEPESNKRFNLKGQTTSMIRWDPDNSTWKLTSVAFKGVARLITENPYPMGRQKWLLEDGASCKGHPSYSEILLSLSVCKENEFSCDDGTCIPIRGRCDKIRDCPDSTDENHCFPVILPDQYNMNIGPSTRSNIVSRNKIKIHINWFIAQLADFTPTLFTMTFHYNLTWKDNRLRFQNLIPGDKSLNFLVNDSKLWHPRIHIPNIHEVRYMKSAFMFKRNSEPIMDRSGPREKLIFDGTHTPITFIQTGQAKFFCDFSFMYFPYDHPTCNIGIMVAQSSEQILHLLGGKVYSNKLLSSSEYVISSARFISYNTSRVFTEVTLQLGLHKNWGRPFLLFYINPLFVFAFAYSTLWLEIDETLLRVFIAFNSVIISFAILHVALPTIPSTLYLKIVDIWNIYFLMVNISILALHIFIHIHRKKDVIAALKRIHPIYFTPMESRIVPGEINNAKVIQRKNRNPSGAYMAQKLNNGCRIFTLLLTLFFVAINVFLIIFHVLNSREA